MGGNKPYGFMSYLRRVEFMKLIVQMHIKTWLLLNYTINLQKYTGSKYIRA